MSLTFSPLGLPVISHGLSPVSTDSWIFSESVPFAVDISIFVFLLLVAVLFCLFVCILVGLPKLCYGFCSSGCRL